METTVVGLDGLVHRFIDFGHWSGLRARRRFSIIEGVDEMIRALHLRFPLAVVTTRGRRDATAFLEAFDLTAMFKAVVSRENTWRIKPHPSPIRHAAKILGVPVDRCLMVGDTTPDIKAARAAGAQAWGVLCGFGERDELEKAGASVILERTPDLLDHSDVISKGFPAA